MENYHKARELARFGFQQIDAEMLKNEAKKRGMKPAELKSVIRDMCSDQPRSALLVLELFIPKESAS